MPADVLAPKVARTSAGMVLMYDRQQVGLLHGEFSLLLLNKINIRISTKNSLKFVPKGLINNIPALVLIMAWRRPGDKPLSEPMLVRSLTHICLTVTWPQNNSALSFSWEIMIWQLDVYHQISNISQTKSQNLNVSHLVLQLSLPIPLKPGVKSRMNMMKM